MPKLFGLIGLFLLLALSTFPGCQSPSKKGEAASGEGAFTENHLELAKWNRTSRCCTAKGKRLAIASGGDLSSRAGIEMEGKGGNAIDAAVAVAFGLAVERPQSLGLGGGGFLLLHLNGPKAQEVFVDFRETAPHRASRDMYLDASGKVIPGKSTEGAMAVATPGFVAGLYELHHKYGKLPWADVLAPSIRMAGEGFPIYHTLAGFIAGHASAFARDPYLGKIFLKQGKPLGEGDKLVQADLARTLEIIARQGKAPFYTGSIAHKIVATIRKNKGILDARDLRKYEVKLRTPLIADYGNFRLVTAPPPSAGGVMVVEMLHLLKPFDLKALSATPSAYAHLLGEVMKRAYADRSRFIGDPDFVQTGYDKLLTDAYADRVRPKINLQHSTPSAQVSPGDGFVQDHGTSQLSVIDAEGNAISATLTINDIFGAMLGVPGTGILLNNEMDDFSAKPGEKNTYGLVGAEANAIGPGRRPVSSMTPTIVLQADNPVLAVGGAGGSRITSSVFQVILNDVLIKPFDVHYAVFAPRVHQQWLPDKLDLEEGFPEETRKKLAAMGNVVGKWDWRANVEAVGRDPEGWLTAVFDPRDGGGAVAQ